MRNEEGVMHHSPAAAATTWPLPWRLYLGNDCRQPGDLIFEDGDHLLFSCDKLA